MSTTGAPSTSQRTLRHGARGDAVKALQDALRRAGHDPGSSDGHFGPKTLAAVQSFQRAKGRSPDSVVGPRTWAALSPPTVAGGSKARSVSEQGVAFIAGFGGFRAQPYNDGPGRSGHATIGYGHWVTKGPINGSEPARSYSRALNRSGGGRSPHDSARDGWCSLGLVHRPWPYRPTRHSVHGPGCLPVAPITASAGL